MAGCRFISDTCPIDSGVVGSLVDECLQKVIAKIAISGLIGF
jgi:hypothetical protein